MRTTRLKLLNAASWSVCVLTKVTWQDLDHSGRAEQESRIVETTLGKGDGGGGRIGTNKIKKLASSQIFKIIALLYFSIHFNVTVNSGELPFLKTMLTGITPRGVLTTES